MNNVDGVMGLKRWKQAQMSVPALLPSLMVGCTGLAVGACGKL